MVVLLASHQHLITGARTSSAVVSSHSQLNFQTSQPIDSNLVTSFGNLQKSSNMLAMTDNHRSRMTNKCYDGILVDIHSNRILILHLQIHNLENISHLTTLQTDPIIHSQVRLAIVSPSGHNSSGRLLALKAGLIKHPRCQPQRATSARVSNCLQEVVVKQHGSKISGSMQAPVGLVASNLLCLILVTPKWLSRHS
jgi:hypothetical protein